MNMQGKIYSISNTMASLISLSYTTFLMIIAFLLLSISVTSSTEIFSQELAESTTNVPVEKTTHLHFYFQQIIGGKNSTAAIIVNREKNFGSMVVIDDPMTQGPERDSKVIGRVQGIYSLASQTDIALMMTVTFVFTEGKYNGSSFSMVGRNNVMDNVREMPIVGGSGVFRFCRGYAQANTVIADFVKGTATVEYNVFVKH